MSQETLDFIRALFDSYQESSSGKEEENTIALFRAEKELMRFAKPRTLVIEIQGGVLQAVHGLRKGDNYELADWDMVEEGETVEEAEEIERKIKTIIANAQAQN